MPLRTAYRLCPDAVYLPVDFDSYAAISQRIKAILHEFSPTCEDSGLDEAYLDISHRDEPPEQIAAAIKKNASGPRPASLVRLASALTSCWPSWRPI